MINALIGQDIASVYQVAGLDKLFHPIDDYALVMQCGGCMIKQRQLINRLKDAKKITIPLPTTTCPLPICMIFFNMQ